MSGKKYKCFIKNCTHLGKMHSMPLDNRREDWLNAIKEEYRRSSNIKYPKICELHFKPSDYTTSIIHGAGTRGLLKKEAVPSIFPSLEDFIIEEKNSDIQKTNQLKRKHNNNLVDIDSPKTKIMRKISHVDENKIIIEEGNIVIRVEGKDALFIKDDVNQIFNRFCKSKDPGRLHTNVHNTININKTAIKPIINKNESSVKLSSSNIKTLKSNINKCMVDESFESDVSVFDDPMNHSQDSLHSESDHNLFENQSQTTLKSLKNATINNLDANNHLTNKMTKVISKSPKISSITSSKADSFCKQPETSIKSLKKVSNNSLDTVNNLTDTKTKVTSKPIKRVSNSFKADNSLNDQPETSIKSKNNSFNSNNLLDTKTKVTKKSSKRLSNDSFEVVNILYNQPEITKTNVISKSLKRVSDNSLRNQPETSIKPLKKLSNNSFDTSTVLLDAKTKVKSKSPKRLSNDSFEVINILHNQSENVISTPKKVSNEKPSTSNLINKKTKEITKSQMLSNVSFETDNSHPEITIKPLKKVSNISFETKNNSIDTITKMSNKSPKRDSIEVDNSLYTQPEITIKPLKKVSNDSFKDSSNSKDSKTKMISKSLKKVSNTSSEIDILFNSQSPTLKKPIKKASNNSLEIINSSFMEEPKTTKKPLTEESNESSDFSVDDLSNSFDNNIPIDNQTKNLQKPLKKISTNRTESNNGSIIENQSKIIKKPSDKVSVKTSKVDNNTSIENQPSIIKKLPEEVSVKASKIYKNGPIESQPEMIKKYVEKVSVQTSEIDSISSIENQSKAVKKPVQKVSVNISEVDSNSSIENQSKIVKKPSQKVLTKPTEVDNNSLIENQVNIKKSSQKVLVKPSEVDNNSSNGIQTEIVKKPVQKVVVMPSEVDNNISGNKQPEVVKKSAPKVLVKPSKVDNNSSINNQPKNIKKITAETDKVNNSSLVDSQPVNSVEKNNISSSNKQPKTINKSIKKADDSIEKNKNKQVDKQPKTLSKNVTKPMRKTDTSFKYSIYELKNFPAELWYFCGVENYEQFLTIFRSIKMHYTNYKNKCLVNFSLENQLFLILWKLRTNCSDKEISENFGIDEKFVFDVFKTWIVFMSNYWRNMFQSPEEDLLLFYITHTFKHTTPEIDLEDDEQSSAIKENRRFIFECSPYGLISIYDLKNNSMPVGTNVVKEIESYQKHITLNDLSNETIDPKPFILKNSKYPKHKDHIENMINSLKLYEILSSVLNDDYFSIASEIFLVCVMLYNFKE